MKAAASFPNTCTARSTFAYTIDGFKCVFNVDYLCLESIFNFPFSPLTSHLSYQAQKVIQCRCRTKNTNDITRYIGYNNFRITVGKENTFAFLHMIERNVNT